MNSTIKELLVSLDKSPWDESLLGVLADAYEDEGNPLHLGIRHMIQNNRYPSFWKDTEVKPDGVFKVTTWFDISRMAKRWHKDRDILSHELFCTITGWHMESDSNGWFDFPDLSSAVLAYADAYNKLFSKETP